MDNDILTIDNKMRSILTDETLSFYKSDTIDLIDRYKQILKVPMKINFMGKRVNSSTNQEKLNIENQYIKMTSQYYNIEYDNSTSDIFCKTCNTKIEILNLEDTVNICETCSSEYEGMNTCKSYTDASRVYVSSKYSYDRKNHFRECINQYQGKQNISIEPQIYKDIEEKIKFHNLLVGDETTDRIHRYENVTKKVILSFLKELGLSKHYENVNLIFSVVTGNKLDDIEYLDNMLMNDFEIISDTYDKLYSDTNRKNFINTQYVIYQLLCRLGHKCNKDDFSGVKTMDRRFFHENILKNLFEHLRWNYTPMF